MVSKSFYFKLVLALLFAILFIGCSVGKRVPEGKHQLKKNTIRMTNIDLPLSDIRQFIKQSPDRRLTRFIPFTSGEAIVFDENLMYVSVNQIKLFLDEAGYFNSEVEASVKYSEKKAYVEYKITGNKPYTIRQIRYQVRDTHLARYFFQDTLNTLLKRGKRYDANTLNNERERVTRNIRNQGFFNFSNNFIFFDVDSALNNHQVDILMRITNPVVGQREPETNNQVQKHKRYIIDKVFVHPDFSPFGSTTVGTDTTTYYPEKGNTLLAIHFVHDQPLKIRPSIIYRNMLLKPGQPYDASKAELTYNYLSRLRNHRFVNLLFQETDGIVYGEVSDSIGFLDMRVQLSPSPVNSFTIEAEGFNTAGNQGLGVNFLFSNRNLFNGAERLNLRLKSATELSVFGRRDEDGVKRFFHSFEFGAEASLEIPKLIPPLSFAKIPPTAKPLSSIKTGLNYKQRPSYTRFILNASYEYDWSVSAQMRNFLNLLEVSSIKISKEQDFIDWLENQTPLLVSRYNNYLAIASKYSLIYNTQGLSKSPSFFFVRGNLELPSPFLFPAIWLFAQPNEDGQQTLFKIPYAQFFKTDFDLRYNHFYDEKNSLAIRFFTGVGVPFGNSEVLPFVKSYYSGGANSVRAWRIYTLGPGGAKAPEDLRFDRFGDIKLESNVEYRFPIYRFLRGAIFVDAGNVWFLNENEDFPGGEFKFNRFLSEIAIGTGFGLRLDIQFFVIRVDASVPIRDPSQEPGNRWVSSYKKFGNWNFNLAIGYPF